MSCLSSKSFAASPSTSLPLFAGASTSTISIMENFITDFMPGGSESASFCATCSYNGPVYSKCIDCNEPLCNACVRAHKTARLTKDHRICKYSSANTPSPTTSSTTRAGSVGSSSQISTSPCPVINNVCDIHKEPQTLFCHTCYSPACGECLVEGHCNHQLNYLDDAIESAKSTNRRLNAEIRLAIMNIREAINDIQHVSDKVEIKSIQAATEIQSMTRMYMSAVTQREVDLLKRIDQSRQIKGNLLISQMDNLRTTMQNLTRTSELLNQCVDTTNAYELMVTNERAANDLKQIRSLKPELQPCENDSISFQPPDSRLLRAISSMGNMSISLQSMSSRTLRPPGNQEQPIPGRMHGIIELPTLQQTRNCTIYGADRVLVKDASLMPSAVFGTEGEKDGQLCRPWGVCCDQVGKYYVADRSNNRIQIFSPTGQFMHKFGSHGTGPGQFDRPAGVAISPKRCLVVADKDNHRIQVFALDGTFLYKFGEKGNRNGQFNYPWDVAVNYQGQIVVTDTRNHRIQLFSAEGIFLNKYGYEGSSTMWKHFDSPRGVCFTPTDHVIVTDFNNHRLVVIDPLFRRAQYLGEEGTNCKQFLRPQGVVCDDEGKIAVTDSRNNRIQVFERNGSFRWKLGHMGKTPGKMDRPSGICLNPEGRVAIVDFGNSRIQVF